MKLANCWLSGGRRIGALGGEVSEVMDLLEPL